ncbi:thiopurine S-methyltransferase [Elysia marginata]|uniref:Thiopurine S-methyltransferase n=1 Tax=Elysia marginata TaxID=1093978 RepID=A0AAV4EKC5_9GAST|nr:thiopurine S-methyltransferase [Elysia marginata]
MTQELNRTAPGLFHTDVVKYWQQRYDGGDTYWLRKEATAMLVKHYNKLNPEGKAQNMLLPLCGKSVDLDWLSSQGVPLVVGVDCLLAVLREVSVRSGQSWIQTQVSESGSDFQLLERSDGKMKLYSGDMLRFSTEIAGTFDAMWERGSLIILPPTDINKYAELLKSLLNPGGRILLESIEFDKDAIDPATDYMPFPPFPYFPKDIRLLFEPECTVEYLDKSACKWKYGKETHLVIYLITKKNM